MWPQRVQKTRLHNPSRYLLSLFLTHQHNSLWLDNGDREKKVFITADILKSLASEGISTGSICHLT